MEFIRMRSPQALRVNSARILHRFLCNVCKGLLTPVSGGWYTSLDRIFRKPCHQQLSAIFSRNS
jgi:hypothetical protein